MVKINDYTDEEFYRYLRGTPDEQIYFFGLKQIVFPWCPDGFIFLSQAINLLGKEHYHEEWTGFEIITYPMLESYKNQSIEKANEEIEGIVFKGVSGNYDFSFFISSTRTRWGLIRALETKYKRNIILLPLLLLARVIFIYLFSYSCLFPALFSFP